MATNDGAGYSHNEKDRGHAWIILAVCFVSQMIGTGLFFAAGMINTMLLEAFQDSKGLTAVPSTTMAALLLLGSFPAAMVDNRFGQKKTVFFGALMKASGLILSAFAPSIIWLIPSLGVLCGFGLALCYMPTLTILPLYFERHLTAAYSITTAGGSVGLLVLSFFVTWAVNEYSWRGMLLLLAGLALHQCVVALFLSKPRSRHLLVPLIEDVEEDCNMNGDSSTNQTQTDVKLHSFIEKVTHSQLSLIQGTQGSKDQDTSGLCTEAHDIPSSKILVQQLRGLETILRGNADRSDPAFNGCSKDNYANKIDRLTGSSESQENINKKSTNGCLSSVNERVISNDFCVQMSHNKCLRNIAFASDNFHVHSHENISMRDFLHKTHLSDSKTNIQNRQFLSENDLHHNINKNTNESFKLYEIDKARYATCSSIVNLPLTGSHPKEKVNSFEVKEGQQGAVGSFYWAIFLNAAYRLQLASAFLRSASRSIFYIFITAFALQRGFNMEQASLLMTLLAVSHIIMRPLSGILATKFHIHQQLWVGSAALAGLLICILVVFSSHQMAIFAFTFVFGSVEAAYEALGGGMLSEALESHEFGSGLGALNFVYGIANLLAPPFAGWLVDVTDSYDIPLYLDGVLSVLAGVVALLAVLVYRRSRGHKDAKRETPVSQKHHEESHIQS